MNNMLEKKLGKIKSIQFGHVGYQEAMLGLRINFEGEGWGVADDKHCMWDPHKIKWSENCKWTEKSRDEQFAEIMRYISDQLNAAKVDDINKLVGKPVEVTFDGNILSDWRILKEVL